MADSSAYHNKLYQIINRDDIHPHATHHGYLYEHEDKSFIITDVGIRQYMTGVLRNPNLIKISKLDQKNENETRYEIECINHRPLWVYVESPIPIENLQDESCIDISKSYHNKYEVLYYDKFGAIFADKPRHYLTNKLAFLHNFSKNVWHVFPTDSDKNNIEFTSEDYEIIEYARKCDKGHILPKNEIFDELKLRLNIQKQYFEKRY